MAFKTATVEHDGETYRLRELSAGALMALEGLGSDSERSLASIGLSMMAPETSTEPARPLYTSVDAAVAWASAQPLSLIRDVLQRVCLELNGMSADDAAGN